MVTTGGCGGGSASWLLVNLGVNNDGEGMIFYAVLGSVFRKLRNKQ